MKKSLHPLTTVLLTFLLIGFCIGSSSTNNLPGEPVKANPMAAPLRIEVESFNAMTGVANYGTNVGATDAGDWMRYDNVNLGSGYTTLSVNYAKANGTGTGQFDIRLDNPTTGTLIGTLNTSGTGGWSTFITASTSLNGASGIQTLYVVFPTGSNNGNFDWFEF